MITHGNKQISEIVYARKASEGGGAVRLTNIIRGAQVVFGGLSPSPSSKWLKGTTMAAILAAFGQTDGKAVINATNAYLNGIAATDKSKASALAGFINEDPMMVCSLGLQPQGVTMPIRMLKGDGNSYINTEKYITSNNFTEILVRTKFTNVVVNDENDVVTNTAVVAEVYRGYKYTWFVRPWRSWDDVIREDGTAAMTDDTLHILPNGMYIASNPSRFYSQNKEPAATSPFWFFRRPGNLYPYSGGLAIAEVKVDNTYLFSCIPFIRNNVNGMIDTLTGTFYPNANTSGSFTIEYTLPDGTPWTPLNQTP